MSPAEPVAAGGDRPPMLAARLALRASAARFGVSYSGLRSLGGESIRYLVVSAFALGCDVAVYASLIKGGVMTTAAGALGYVAGILVHYTLSTVWVFPDVDGSRRTAPTFVKFAATGLLGLAITATIIDVLTRHAIAGAFTAKGVAIACTYLAVFLLRRGYVFAAASRR